MGRNPFTGASTELGSRSKSPISTADSASDLELVRVRSARHVQDHIVEFTFTDGSVREIDLERYLWGPAFERVRKPEYFRKFRVDRTSGTITWPNGANIDPDVLYLELVLAGQDEESSPSIHRYSPVRRAKYVRDYTVEFTFADGTKREMDLEPFLHGGIFETLRSPETFLRFKVRYGTIVWPNGADIAPETLYHNLGPVPQRVTDAEAAQS